SGCGAGSAIGGGAAVVTVLDRCIKYAPITPAATATPANATPTASRRAKGTVGCAGAAAAGTVRVGEGAAGAAVFEAAVAGCCSSLRHSAMLWGRSFSENSSAWSIARSTVSEYL